MSLTSGTIGPGLAGDYVNVTDTLSVFVEVSSTSTGQIKVTDAVGIVHANGLGCTESGAAVLCNPVGLEGLKIEGSDKNDVLRNSTNLPASMAGDHGDDVMHGGSATDWMNGQVGDDISFGDGGEDVFSFESGHDLLAGGAATDTVSYSAAPSAVNVTLIDDVTFDDGPSGDGDRITGIENAIGSPYNDVLKGTDGPNTMSGRAGNDVMRGFAGNDLQDGDEGADDIGGGLDVDTVTYAERTAGVVVSLNSLTGDGEPGEGDNIRADVENLKGGSGPGELFGQASTPVANRFDGNGGVDTLDGAAGEDEINGGAGNDTVIGDVGRDSYDGGTGTDMLDYSNRSDEFTEDVEVTLANSLLIAGNDGGPSDGPVDDRDNAWGFEGVTTGDGDDKVTGTDFADTIITGKGVDEVEPAPATTP